MPAAAAAAVTGFTSLGAAGGIGGTIAGITYAATYVATAAAISYGISTVTNELFGPEMPSFDEDMSRRLDMRMDSHPPRRFIYGETRVSGPMSFAQATPRVVDGEGSETNEVLWYEVVIASHEIDSYQTIYLNEQPATLAQEVNEAWPPDSNNPGDSNGVARWRPGGTVYTNDVMLKVYKGGQADADADFVAGSTIGGITGRSNTDVGRDIAYIGVVARHDGEIFQNGIPKISAIVRGKNDIYDPRDGGYAYTNNPALCLVDWMITPREKGGGGWDYDEIDEAALIAAANICDGTETVTEQGASQTRYKIGGSFLATTSRANIIKLFLDSMVGSIERVNGKWYMRAGAYTTPVVTLDTDNWLQPLSMSFRTTLKDSANAIRPVLAGDFSEYQESEVALVRAELPQDVTPDETANTFSQTPEPMENGYMVRFDLWATNQFLPQNLPAQILQNVYYWVVNSNATTFQISATRGGSAIDFAAFGATGQPVCFWDKYLSEDQGKRRIIDRKYQLVNDPEQARRLAFTELKRMRSEVTVNALADLTAFNVQVGDIVTVNDTLRGFSSKIFEVMRWGFGMQNGHLGVSLVLRSATDNDWSWDNSYITPTEDHEEVHVQNLRDIDPPTAFTVESGTAHLYKQKDGTIIPRAFLSWTGSGSSLISIAGEYEIQLRRTVAAPDPETNPENNWLTADFVHGSTTEYYIVQPEEGVDYDFRVRAKTAIGFTTDWAEVLAHTILGKTEPPNNVTGLTATFDSDRFRTTLQWTNPTDLDLRAIGIWLGVDGGDKTKLATIPVGERGGEQRWVDTYVISSSGSTETWEYELETEDTTGNFSDDPNPTASITAPVVETPTLPSITGVTSFSATARTAGTSGSRFTCNVSHPAGALKIVYHPTADPEDNYTIDLPANTSRSNATLNLNVRERDYEDGEAFTFLAYRGEYVSDTNSYFYSTPSSATADLTHYTGGLADPSALNATYVSDEHLVVLRFLVPTFVNLAKCKIYVATQSDYSDKVEIGEWVTSAMAPGLTSDTRKATWQHSDVYPKPSTRTLYYMVTSVDIYGTESAGSTAGARDGVLVPRLAWSLGNLDISTDTREITFQWDSENTDDTLAIQVLKDGDWKRQKLRYANVDDDNGGSRSGLTISDLDWTGTTNIRMWRGFARNGRTVWSEEYNPMNEQVGNIDPPAGFDITTDGNFGIKYSWNSTDISSTDWVAIQRWPASNSSQVADALQDVLWVKADLLEYKERADWTGWVGAIAWKVQDLNGKQFKSAATDPAVYVQLSEFSAPSSATLSGTGVIEWTVNEQYPFVRIDIENTSTNTIYTPKIIRMDATPYNPGLPMVGDTFQIWVSYAESERVYGAKTTDTTTISSPT